MREVALAVAKHDEVVRGAVAALGPEVNRTDYWFGPDADAFRRTWESVTAPNIRALADRLDEIRNVLERQAQEQDIASSANGGSVFAAALGSGASTFGVQHGAGISAIAGKMSDTSDDKYLDEESVEEVMRRPHFDSKPMDDEVRPPLLPGLTIDEVADRLALAQSAQEVADLWNGDEIHEVIKQRIIENYPHLIRNRDGIPLNDRASANKAWAAENLDRIREKYGADSDITNVVEQVAKGGEDDMKAVYLNPPRDIIAMYGELKGETQRVVIHNPQTGGKFEEFARHPDGAPKGGYLGIPEHLHSNDKNGTVVLVYQKGDWAQSIPIVQEEGPLYASDPAVYDRLGRELANFQRNGLWTDPHGQRSSPGYSGISPDGSCEVGMKMVGMGYSFGNSVTTASEMHGAQYDTVIAIAGGNAPTRWNPTEGTKYIQFEYNNDMLNVANDLDDALERVGKGQSIGIGRGGEYPGINPDHHAAWEKYRDYGSVPGEGSLWDQWQDKRKIGTVRAHRRAGTYNGREDHENREMFLDILDVVQS